MKPRKYTLERLKPIVQESTSWAEVCRNLGIKPSTGSQTHVKKVSDSFDLDTAHFLRGPHNKGKVFGPKNPIGHYLVEDGPFVRSHYLKTRLIKEGLKEEKCEGCNLTTWRDQKIPLELDHINGKHEDNRLENLQILCPNCHAQTPTYCRRKSVLAE